MYYQNGWKAMIDGKETEFSIKNVELSGVSSNISWIASLTLSLTLPLSLLSLSPFVFMNGELIEVKGGNTLNAT